MRSAIFEGTVFHRRVRPVRHEFTQRVALPLLDLDEVDEVCSYHPLWSSHRANAVHFRRSDFYGPPQQPLAEAIRDLVEERTGARPEGSVRMGRGTELSAHLASRHQVGEILASGSTPTTELRAAVIIGAGSISFEMLRYLTEVLPAMVTPRWVRTRCQPIAIRDVLYYLAAVLNDPETIDRVLEIGGPDVVTYAEMMQTYAEVAGLPRRFIVPVPFLSPRLSSRWVGLVTPLPASIAVPLIDSLRHEVVMTDHEIDTLVPHQPLGFRESLELALRLTRAEAIDTRWTDTGFTPADTIPGDPDWAGGSLFEDHQTVDAVTTPEALYRAFARIGGEHGYYVSNWAWSVRGLIDKLVGGPGLRRGRRHPLDLRRGDALDFWRVVDAEPGLQLVLQAEMKLPGKAWLT